MSTRATFPRLRPAAAVLALSLLLAGCGLYTITRLDGSSTDERQAAFEAAIEEYSLRNPGTLTAAKVSNGETELSYSADAGFEIASLAKLEILTRWLLLRQQQDIPTAELALAERMITESDNDAASRLCRIVAAHGNEAASLPGGTGDCAKKPSWGATQTTAARQHELLETIVASSKLNTSARAVMKRLTGSIVPQQSWGISAASRDGERYWLKNGWDVRRGGWVAHTSGVIETADGEYVLLTVLTDGNHSHAAGIAHAEDVATLAREALPA